MLNIRETFAYMGKLSNNLEKHGDKEVTAFDIPIDQVTLTGEEFNALQEDPYADRWFFDHKGEVREPNLAKFEPLKWTDTFDGAIVVIKCGDDTFTFTDARIKDVTFVGRRGGDVIVALAVRVRPENDKQILKLIAYQNHEIRIDVQDAKVVMKGGRKQQELPLNVADDNEKPQGELTHPEQLFGKKRGRKPRPEAH